MKRADHHTKYVVEVDRRCRQWWLDHPGVSEMPDDVFNSMTEDLDDLRALAAAEMHAAVISFFRDPSPDYAAAEVAALARIEASEVRSCLREHVDRTSGKPRYARATVASFLAVMAWSISDVLDALSGASMTISADELLPFLPSAERPGTPMTILHLSAETRRMLDALGRKLYARMPFDQVKRKYLPNPHLVVSELVAREYHRLSADESLAANYARHLLDGLEDVIRSASEDAMRTARTILEHVESIGADEMAPAPR